MPTLAYIVSIVSQHAVHCTQVLGVFASSIDCVLVAFITWPPFPFAWHNTARSSTYLYWTIHFVGMWSYWV